MEDRCRSRRTLSAPEEVPLSQEDDQRVEHAERGRRHHEEVHRRDVLHVVLEEGPLGLRRRLARPWHEAPDRSFGDVDAQHQQLSVDARSAPGRVRLAHLLDEAANARRRRRPSASGPS